jgi:hypothetical protein
MEPTYVRLLRHFNNRGGSWWPCAKTATSILGLRRNAALPETMAGDSYSMKYTSILALAFSVAGCAHVPATSNQSGRMPPFILGADITSLLEA